MIVITFSLPIVLQSRDVWGFPSSSVKLELVSGTTRYPRVPRSSSTSSSFPSMEVEPIRGILGRAPSIFQPSLSPRSYFPISRIFNPKVPYLWLWPSGKKRKLSRKESEERDLRYLPSLFPLNSIVVGEGHECRIPWMNYAFRKWLVSLFLFPP